MIQAQNLHMAWVRVVCGRSKSDHDYSTKIVYNNFLRPMPAEVQKKEIEQTAQAILDARKLHPDRSLAAHQQNDRAVMRAYGFDIRTTTESSCVAESMKMYQKRTEHR
ncbi:type IIL restriction-modification enzyme MmeI [Pseudoflavonifractor sp. MSJ-37]|uniref:type IIL restriction-modification enzyme MmeI n=1 Tax=Pseudoflavonifractor sp. MSJ-37 TaxID=2841531 RepID=UPI001C10E0AE|nr:type IIL restriction-modification enzyme MmeI [Pseudoflavonifractor sp. MSJ-37]MBU5435257.1 hypothetical protein [Pseudoflavonifractor sp. MSJ-37]